MQNNKFIWLRRTVFLFLFVTYLFSVESYAQVDLSTDYFRIQINGSGFITSMKNISKTPNQEFSPGSKPSPLLCLYNSKKNIYYEPQTATYSSGTGVFTLNYANGSVAQVKIETKTKYFKLTLQSLTNRYEIDDIQWGAYHTSITNLFGEVIGVARDTSETINYAIGVLSLSDSTTGGRSTNIADCAPFQYIIHSPNPTQFPLPANLHEGQIFPIGGNGISDVDFYAHPEAYYRVLYGNSAEVDGQGQISIVYHASDRRKKKTVFFSLMPQKETNTPNHIEVEPLPNVDYIGSKIALWGSPDSIALMTVIKNIVQSEGLPYLQVNDKWIKDPAAYIPDVYCDNGLFDSTISYTNQLGFKALHLENLGMFGVDRANNGYIDGTSFENKPFPFTSGNKSHKEVTDISIPLGIWAGRHTITTSLRNGTMDVSPIPNDNLCYQVKRVLAKGICATDTYIEVTNPEYLDEIGSWEMHEQSLNFVKIGKEIIYYKGISQSPPYTLQNVTRGHWGTTATNHEAGDTVYKLQVTIGFGYQGLIPNMALQDSIAFYYADMANINGLYYYDWDGHEFLFNTGHGFYGVKRFHRKLFERAASHNLPDLRINGVTFSEGAWHYMSSWNVGGQYFNNTSGTGGWTNQGKDLRDVAYSNYFPVSLARGYRFTSTSTVAHYNNLQAMAIGIGSTYAIAMSMASVESCPNKYAIFAAIKTWENAKAANAFSRSIKKQLADPTKHWELDQVNSDNWKLYPIVGGVRGTAINLTRDIAGGY